LLKAISSELARPQSAALLNQVPPQPFPPLDPARPHHPSEANADGELNDPSWIQDKLFSASRRQYSDDFVRLYEVADQSKRQDLGAKLLAAIVPNDGDHMRRYRVNIYVARTFALLPRVTDNTTLPALRRLKDSPEYKTDLTFRQNVNAALKKQGDDAP
jgi:hypothetical protein